MMKRLPTIKSVKSWEASIPLFTLGANGTRFTFLTIQSILTIFSRSAILSRKALRSDLARGSYKTYTDTSNFRDFIVQQRNNFKLILSI